jgi:crotonobetainyl-CoA:carnitine CoA-transferase CaiB-like acyl-CoA transferase
MVRMPGYGLAGPWRDYVGWALNFEQVSGMAAATGYPDGPPCDLQGPADPIAGVHATIALLSALEHRRRTGEGQLVEIAQIEACAAIAALPVIEYSMTGVVPRREGNRHRVYAQGVYPAADDTWVALSVRDDADWAAVLDITERPDLLSDKRFATVERRLSNHDAFDDLIAGWTRTRSPDDVVDALTARGVPAERLVTGARMYDIPQLDARGYYQELQHPLTGSHRYPGWPFRITPGPLRHHRLPTPTLGQHNLEVLAGMGLSDQDIAALRETAVIGERLLST